jgi:hypothetical protein
MGVPYQNFREESVGTSWLDHKCTPGAVTTVLNLTKGTYQFELAVTDAEGAVGRDSMYR